MWEDICTDDSYDDYIYMWIKDKYNLNHKENTSSSDDSDSDYVPSESETDSESYISSSESDLSDSEITELKIGKSRVTNKDIKID